MSMAVLVRMIVEVIIHRRTPRPYRNLAQSFDGFAARQRQPVNVSNPESQ
jgi:hypothetical protein